MTSKEVAFPEELSDRNIEMGTEVAPFALLPSQTLEWPCLPYVLPGIWIASGGVELRVPKAICSVETGAGLRRACLRGTLCGGHPAPQLVLHFFIDSEAHTPFCSTATNLVCFTRDKLPTFQRKHSQTVWEIHSLMILRLVHTRFRPHLERVQN